MLLSNCASPAQATNLDKLYFTPKIYKQLYKVPGRPVISNFRFLTEKESQFFNFHLKPLMESYSHVFEIR